MQLPRIAASILLISIGTIMMVRGVAHLRHHHYINPTPSFNHDRFDEMRTSYDQGDQISDGSARSDQDYAGEAAHDRDSASSTTPDPSPWSREGDRSATVLLPPNWQLAGVAGGTVQVKGPDREQVVLGYQTFLIPGTQDFTPYMEPDRALAWFLQTHGSQLVRVLKREPGPANPDGEAEFITAEVRYEGNSYRLEALIRTTNMQMNTWSFQVSYMSAPEERFDAEFSTMQAIWNSWKLDGGEINRRLETAGEMHERTVDNARRDAEGRIHANDNQRRSWDRMIRGRSVMEDNGERRETDYRTEGEYLRDCREHFRACRELPDSELSQPQ